MNYKDGITAEINKALKKKLSKEARGASKLESKLQFTNIEAVNKRRQVEAAADRKAISEKLGVNIMEVPNEY